MAKYLSHNGAGLAAETLTITTSGGAVSADKIPSTNSQGVLDPSILGAATTGANKIGMTGPDGRFDVTTMPSGFGIDAFDVVASEALAAGDAVNVHTVSGASRVRKADASTGKPAHGYVLSAVANGGTAKVYFEQTNTQASGMTPGTLVYLSSTPGQVVSSTPPAAPALAQIVGFALTATAYKFDPYPPIQQVVT